MKKKLLALLLLVPILLIPIISCEGDALGGLSDLMGTFGTNSLIESGIVVIDTSHGAKTAEAMSGLAEADDYDAAVQAIRDMADEALASKGSAKANAFVEEMKKEKKSETPQEVKNALNGLGIDEEVLETEGDLLAAVLLTDLVGKADDLGPAPTEEEILEFVSEALQVIDIVKTVSPVSGIKIDDILGDILAGGDFGDLFRGRGASRDGEDEIEQALGMIKPLLDSVVREIEKDSNGYVKEKGLKRMISSFAMMRTSYEKLAPHLESSGEELELTDIFNYILSVIFTEAEDLIRDATNDIKGFKDLINAYIDWDKGDENAFDPFEELFEEDGNDNLMNNTLERAETTLLLLLDATPGGELIKELFEED